MTFSASDWDSEVEDQTVVCRTMIGDKYGSSVSQYDEDFTGDNDIIDNMWPVREDETDAALSFDESIFTASEDKDNYDSRSDDTFAWVYCTVEIVVSERNEEALEGIFDTVFDVEYGLYLFEDKHNSGTLVSEEESYNFQVYIASPDFDDSWVEPEEEEPMKEAFYPIETEDGTDSYMEFAISFDTYESYSDDDILRVEFNIDTNTDAYCGVVMWASFK